MQSTGYSLPHLKGKGITPTWASDYEHLLCQISVSVNSVEVEEEQEDIELDSSIEGDGEEVEHVGSKEEIDAEMELDDDCFDLGD